MNSMKEIRIEKVTVNMGAGEAGPKLDNAKKIIETVTGKKPVLTKARKRTPFGSPKGRKIGAKVTLRGEDATAFLKNALQAKNNKLKVSQFDTSGNFSFGIEEYINLPGIKYDPDVGIVGMDVCVTLERPGYRIKKRRLKPKKVGKKHRITKEEAMEFAKKELGVEVVEGEIKQEYY